VSAPPTERQRRNSRWLARHPGATAGVSAAVFGAIGLAYGAFADVTWLNPALGSVIGVLFGAGIGWGFSVDQRSRRPAGGKKLLYVAILVLGVVVLIGMRYIRSTT
jgi:hypothetical protein